MHFLVYILWSLFLIPFVSYAEDVIRISKAQSEQYELKELHEGDFENCASQVEIVTIDEETDELFGDYRKTYWHANLVSDLLIKLQETRVRALGVDIPYDGLPKHRHYYSAFRNSSFPIVFIIDSTEEKEQYDKDLRLKSDERNNVFYSAGRVNFTQSDYEEGTMRFYPHHPQIKELVNFPWQMLLVSQGKGRESLDRNTKIKMPVLSESEFSKTPLQDIILGRTNVTKFKDKFVILVSDREDEDLVFIQDKDEAQNRWVYLASAFLGVSSL